jgi:hypothetical protein
MQTLPLDIFHHIVEQISAADHPLSYVRNSADTQALLALCLVNRDLNAIATRHLYSSITLSTTTAIKKLAKTVEHNPAALTPCRDILFFDEIIDLDSGNIIASAPNLRRLSARGVVRAYRTVVFDRILTELALSAWMYPPLYECGSFHMLQRLAVFDVFFHVTQVVENLLGLPRLTHLVLANQIARATCDPANRFLTASPSLAGLKDYLARKRVTTKVILGLRQMFEKPHLTEYILTFRRHLEQRFASESLVFIEYGPARPDRASESWFSSRISDGTIWEMKE